MTALASRHASPAIHQAAKGDWPETLTGADVFKMIIFIEAQAMIGPDAIESFDEFYVEAFEDETWTEYQSGFSAKLEVISINSINQDEHGCACPETAVNYATLTTKAPPAYIRDNEILDGQHRLTAAISRGEESILAYSLTII